MKMKSPRFQNIKRVGQKHPIVEILNKKYMAATKVKTAIIVLKIEEHNNRN